MKSLFVSLLKSNSCFLMALIVASIHLSAQSPPILRLPPDVIVTADTSVIFVWDTVLGGIDYHIQVADNPSFSPVQYENQSTLVNNDTVMLTQSKRYYWRVRGNLGSGFTNWSTIWTFIKFSPLDANVTTWYKADYGIQTDVNGNVAQWDDASGNGNHATQANSIQRPLYIASAPNINNLPLIRFDGTDDYVDFSNYLTSINTVFWVIKEDSNATPLYRSLLANSTAPPDFERGCCNVGFPGTDKFIYDDVWTATEVLTGTTRINGKIINPLITDVPTSMSIISTRTNGNTSAGNFSNDRNLDNGRRVWYGDLAELIIFNDPLSDSMIHLVEEYLHYKYSISIPGNLIRGTVFNDLNSNCLLDSAETRLENFLLQINPLQHVISTDSLGTYEFYVDSGSYNIRILSQHPFVNIACPSSGNYNVNFNNQNDTSSNNNFGLVTAIYCPLMEVDISSSFLRRCVSSNYTVHYCNGGTVPAVNAYVQVKLDTSLSVNSSSIPWRLPQTGNIYIFDIGDVDQQECGTFTINVIVDCGALLGQTICVSAHIFPDTICRTPSALWDSSSVHVDAICANNDTVQFRISNSGTGDMQDSLDYYIVEDNVMLRSGTFQLLRGQIHFLSEIANGSTYHFEAEQSTGHPGFSMPSVTLEGCGTNDTGSISLGYVITYPQDDRDRFVSIHCQEVIGSYDPNDKSVYPKGVSSNRIVSSHDELEYIVRFQNTGNDTAFRVIIRDTLSPYLDIASVQPGASSHSYNFRIYGPRILEWTFNNILLPDSNINVQESHGFVKFRVAQDSANTNGTLIENSAAIYFDFNAPVITNETWNTVQESDVPITLLNARINSVANPACAGGDNGAAKISATGGLEPYSYNWSNGETSTNLSGVQAGNYSVTVEDAFGATSSTTVNIADGFDVNSSAITGSDTLNIGLNAIFNINQVTGHSYTWSITNGIIINGQGTGSIEVEFSSAGIGTLTVIVSSQGCSDTVTKNIILIDPTGIANTTGEKIKLYPNPTSGTLSLRTEGVHGLVTIAINDALGKQYLLKTFEAKEIQNGVTIDLKAMPGNVFFLRMSTDKESAVMKVLKF